MTFVALGFGGYCGCCQVFLPDSWFIPDRDLALFKNFLFLFFLSQFCLFSHSLQLWLCPLNIHMQSCNRWKWIRASQLTSMHTNNSNSRVNQPSLWVPEQRRSGIQLYQWLCVCIRCAFFTFKCFAPLSEHDRYLTGSDLWHSHNTSNTAPTRMLCQIHLGHSGEVTLCVQMRERFNPCLVKSL